MNAIKNEVVQLVDKELQSANEKFGPFNSAHEGYAVIKEEVEEAQENMAIVDSCLRWLWSDVRNNRGYINHVETIKAMAIDAACELIQVAAMAQKFIDKRI